MSYIQHHKYLLLAFFALLLVAGISGYLSFTTPFGMSSGRMQDTDSTIQYEIQVIEEETTQEQAPQEEQQVTYGINIVSLTSPIARGSQASITINTAPNVRCTITVYYKSGASKAQGLDPKNSDGNGSCTWSWKVGTRTTPGDWKIVLTAEGAGQIETYFTVTE